MLQLKLFDYENEYEISDLISTRYQGSKLKLLPWIWSCIKDIHFEKALDAFGGSGCVSYLLKKKGKSITYNDLYSFNYHIGKALIENNNVLLTQEDIEFILKPQQKKYKNVISEIFSEIYFTDSENKWLDIVTQNIISLENPYKKAMAFYALFQSCIIKRPYNLFHRKNLYIRTAEVERSFGNKTTWDKPFEEHFLNFVNEINNAIFFNGKKTIAVQNDAITMKNNISKEGGRHEPYDLVYIDTPYMSEKGVAINYLDFYHFLEGMTDYFNWENRIDYSTKHRRLRTGKTPWCDRNTILDAFKRLFYNFRESKIIVSYRSDGIPSPEEIKRLLENLNKKVWIKEYGSYKYVLSKNNKSRELLFITD